MKLVLTWSAIMILGMATLGESNKTTETWWINSAKKDCVGVAPMSCLEIQKNTKIDPEAWELFYSSIKGFDYVPGKIYQIKVKVTKRPEPIPADASSLTYELVEIISEETDLSLRITNIWKVLSVGEIENPTSQRGDQPLTFEFNASARTYFGQTGCNSVRGAIKENDGKNILLGLGATTMMVCPDMSQEKTISNLLSQVRTYKIENGELHFFNESGEVIMRFQAID